MTAHTKLGCTAKLIFKSLSQPLQRRGDKKPFHKCLAFLNFEFGN